MQSFSCKVEIDRRHANLLKHHSSRGQARRMSRPGVSSSAKHQYIPLVSPSVKKSFKKFNLKKYLTPHPNPGAGLPLCWVSVWIFELRPEFLSYRVGIHNLGPTLEHPKMVFWIFGWAHFLGGLLWKSGVQNDKSCKC